MSAVDVLVVGLRALGFIAALQAAGGALFLWLFGDGLERSVSIQRTLARRFAIAGLALLIVHQLIEPARLVGELAGVLDASLHVLLLESDAGAAFTVRLLGLALVAVGVGQSGRDRAAVALIGATLVVVSFAFAGHTAADNARWLLAALLIVHLLAVAFWFGALLPFYVMSRHEALPTSAAVIQRFSQLAAWVVPLILIAGAGIAASLLPAWASLLMPYGALLLVKVAGFTVLMGLASLNKWRLGPLIGAGRERALRGFRLSVAAEWLLIASVLAVTAAMTSWFSPE